MGLGPLGERATKKIEMLFSCCYSSRHNQKSSPQMSDNEEEVATYKDDEVWALSQDAQPRDFPLSPVSQEDFPLSPFSLCGVKDDEEEEEEEEEEDDRTDVGSETGVQEEEEGTVVDSEIGSEIGSESDSGSESSDPSIQQHFQVLKSACRAQVETKKHAERAMKDANEDIERAMRVIARARQDIDVAKRVIARAKRNKTKARKTRRTNLTWLREQITIVEEQIGEERRARTKAKEDRRKATNAKRTFAMALYRSRN